MFEVNAYYFFICMWSFWYDWTVSIGNCYPQDANIKRIAWMEISNINFIYFAKINIKYQTVCVFVFEAKVKENHCAIDSLTAEMDDCFHSCFSRSSHPDINQVFIAEFCFLLWLNFKLFCVQFVMMWTFCTVQFPFFIIYIYMHM